MVQLRLSSLFSILTLLLSIFSFSSCSSSFSPGFVLRAAYEESKILLNRKKIKDILADPGRDSETKRKLALVLDARDFAKKIGLSPKQSFTSYSEIDKDVLVWVLSGSKLTSFDLHTWWFPIVGTVPYKGFFDKNDALSEASTLIKKGYEISIRGAEALSTLGWFNDPVLSTTLKKNDDSIVNTVIHESVHATIWIKNNVSFNESLANFVGLQGSADFFKSKSDRYWLDLASGQKIAQLSLAAVVEKMYSELDELYNSYAPDETKLIWRQKIFEKNLKLLRTQYPRQKIPKEINNSVIMQLKFYMTALDQFEKLYILKDRNWPNFFASIKKISDQVDQDYSLDPFRLLQSEIRAIEIG